MVISNVSSGTTKKHPKIACCQQHQLAPPTAKAFWGKNIWQMKNQNDPQLHLHLMSFFGKNSLTCTYPSLLIVRFRRGREKLVPQTAYAKEKKHTAPWEQPNVDLKYPWQSKQAKQIISKTNQLVSYPPPIFLATCSIHFLSNSNSPNPYRFHASQLNPRNHAFVLSRAKLKALGCCVPRKLDVDKDPDPNQGNIIQNQLQSWEDTRPRVQYLVR